MIPVNINVSRKDGERKTPQGKQARAQPQGCAKAVFFHPDYTVGSGVGPDLLTLRSRLRTCVPVPTTQALAGSCANAPTAGGESHPALKTFVVAGEPACAF
jgi:hypothetical protein